MCYKCKISLNEYSNLSSQKKQTKNKKKKQNKNIDCESNFLTHIQNF